jgi:hypothetical protein
MDLSSVRRSAGRSQSYGAKRVLDANGKLLAHSKREYRRRCDLELLLKLGKIRNLKFQPKFKFVVNGIDIGTWTADFQYDDDNYDRPVVEDSKGHETDVFKLKKQLFLALFPQYQLLIT